MTHRLRVNPIACEAHGMCAELLPERIALDEWGYPVITDDSIDRSLLDHARRAAQACPTFALLVERRAEAKPGRSSVKRAPPSGDSPAVTIPP